MSSQLHNYDILGNGLVQPLRRTTGTDFATGEGEALVRSCIQQLLRTRPGELPWDPDFGVNLERYRHRSASSALGQEICQEIVQAIQEYEPRVSVGQCSATIDQNTIYIKIQWAVVSTATDGNNVLIGPVTQEVAI